MNEELFEKYLQGGLTPEEALQLKELLEDPAEGRRFAEFIQEWTLLAEVSRRLDTAGVRPATARSSVRMVREARAPVPWVGWAAVAAASLFLAVGIAFLSRPVPVPAGTPGPVAQAPAPAPAPPPAVESFPDTPPVRPERPVVPTPPAPAPEPPAPPAPPAPAAVDAPAPPAKPAPSGTEPSPSPAKPSEPRTPAPTVADAVAVATLERVEGDVQLVTRQGRAPARAGMPILADQGLQTTGKGSLAVFRYLDGTRIELGPDSLTERLALRAVPLTRGMLAATVGRQPPGSPVVFATPHAEATVLGTRLSLLVGPASTRLEVREGKVRLRRLDDSASVEVTAGHFAVAEKGVRLDSKTLVLTAELQDGLDGYAGTLDTAISEAEPTRGFGTSDELEADGDEVEGKKLWALLRWDLSSIPIGAIVQSAVITLHIEGASQSPGYQLYEVKAPWTEADATWRRPWRYPGLRPGVDRGTQPLGAVAPRKKGEAAILLEPAVVQGWLRNPASNHGVVIANEQVSDGFKFKSREYKDAARRPKLTVTYTLGK